MPLVADYRNHVGELEICMGIVTPIDILGGWMQLSHSPFPDLLHKLRSILLQLVFPNTGNQRKTLTITGPGAGHLMKTLVREDDIRWHTVPVCDRFSQGFKAQE